MRSRAGQTLRARAFSSMSRFKLFMSAAQGLMLEMHFRDTFTC